MSEMESKVRMPSNVANEGTLGGFNEKFTQEDGTYYEEVNFALGLFSVDRNSIRLMK